MANLSKWKRYSSGLTHASRQLTGYPEPRQHILQSMIDEQLCYVSRRGLQIVNLCTRDAIALECLEDLVCPKFLYRPDFISTFRVSLPISWIKLPTTSLGLEV